MSQTVVHSHHTPRRLCFPAPLFSLAGGLSQREAVLTQQTHTAVGDTDSSEKRPGNELRLSGSPDRARQEKLLLSVADAAFGSGEGREGGPSGPVRQCSAAKTAIHVDSPRCLVAS